MLSLLPFLAMIGLSLPAAALSLVMLKAFGKLPWRWGGALAAAAVLAAIGGLLCTFAARISASV